MIHENYTHTEHKMNMWNKHVLMALLLCFITAIGASSCTRDGCTDQSAINYDTNAITDDGSCLYSAEALLN